MPSALAHRGLRSNKPITLRRPPCAISRNVVLGRAVPRQPPLAPCIRSRSSALGERSAYVNAYCLTRPIKRGSPREGDSALPGPQYISPLIYAGSPYKPYNVLLARRIRATSNHLSYFLAFINFDFLFIFLLFTSFSHSSRRDSARDRENPSRMSKKLRRATTYFLDFIKVYIFSCLPVFLHTSRYKRASENKTA